MALAPEEKRSGRLVQVRIGGGQFGSDMYLIRLRDGSLMRWENAMIRQVDDNNFIEAFYLMNDMTPPNIPPQAPDEGDSDATEYTLGGEFPATGFIIGDPINPRTPGAFSITVTA